jgi:hypothetical protein
VVTVLQRAENLTGRLAAEAVRTRTGLEVPAGLSLDDPGFDHTVLAEFRGKVAEFRGKVAQAGLEQVVLDALLAADGLVKAGGKQRNDSTHVVAAVAALAAACPDWLEQRICVSDWNRRYGTPLTSWRRPRPARRSRTSWPSPAPGTGTPCWKRCNCRPAAAGQAAARREWRAGPGA